MWFEVYEEGAGAWRWRLWSDGGKSVAISAQSYEAKAACLYDIALTMSSSRATIRELDRPFLRLVDGAASG
ncbi:MAG: hypothetical protein AB7K86_05240 [Rhodospirillales bacterium]